jgi:hypothetical protein
MDVCRATHNPHSDRTYEGDRGGRRGYLRLFLRTSIKCETLGRSSRADDLVTAVVGSATSTDRLLDGIEAAVRRGILEETEQVSASRTRSCARCSYGTGADEARRRGHRCRIRTSILPRKLDTPTSTRGERCVGTRSVAVLPIGLTTKMKTGTNNRVQAALSERAAAARPPSPPWSPVSHRVAAGECGYLVGSAARDRRGHPSASGTRSTARTT